MQCKVLKGTNSGEKPQNSKVRSRIQNYRGEVSHVQYQVFIVSKVYEVYYDMHTIKCYYISVYCVIYDKLFYYSLTHLLCLFTPLPSFIYLHLNSTYTQRQMTTQRNSTRKCKRLQVIFYQDELPRKKC